MMLLPQPKPKPTAKSRTPKAHPRAALALALTVLSITTTLPANAADPARAKAKQHFDTAESAYAAKQFSEAIPEYTKAYETLPLPAFLFNIGQCHRGLEQHEEAIAHYERYLKEAGTPDDRELVEQLITESKAALALKPNAATTQQIAQQIADDIAIQVGQDEVTTAPAETPKLNATDPNLVAATTPAASSEEVYEQWWFWPAVATVAVVVAGGTVLAVAGGGDDRTVLPSGSAGTLDWRSP